MIATWRDESRDCTTALEANEAELLEVMRKTQKQNDRVGEMTRALQTELESLDPLAKRTQELEQRHRFLLGRIRDLEERNGDCEGYVFDEHGHLEPTSLVAAVATLRLPHGDDSGRLPRQDEWVADRGRTMTVPRFGDELASDDAQALRALRRHSNNGGDCTALWAQADLLCRKMRTFITPVDQSRTRNVPSYDGGSAA